MRLKVFPLISGVGDGEGSGGFADEHVNEDEDSDEQEAQQERDKEVPAGPAALFVMFRGDAIAFFFESPPVAV